MSTIDLFAGKAERYLRHRVDYPSDVIERAFAAVRLTAGQVVADLGSGTGMLSRWMLERGNQVIGVEPDAGMRAVAERLLGSRTGFTSVPGSAEATTLPDASVDLITVGNAIHYFDASLARVEAERILRPGGRALILGHARPTAPNGFMRAYSLFLEGIAGDAWRFHAEEREASSLRTFFGPARIHEGPVVDQAQALFWEGLSGRFLSTSLAPREGDDRRAAVLAQLEAVFRDHAVDGQVAFQLSWRFVWGTVKPRSRPSPGLDQGGQLVE